MCNYTLTLLSYLVISFLPEKTFYYSPVLEMLGQSFELKRRGMITVWCIRFSRHSFLLQICQKFNFGGHFTHNFRHWNFVDQSSDSVLSNKHIQLKKLFFFLNHMWTLNYRAHSYRYCFSERWVFLINLK